MSEQTAYSLDELMVSVMARHYGSGFRVAAAATYCSQVAALLAQRVVDPRLAVATSFNVLDGAVIPNTMQGEFAVYRQAHVRTRITDLFDLVNRGSAAIWMSPAQVDRWGNANLSAIGGWAHPKVALVGARGLPDNSANLDGVFYCITRHSPASIVPQVDFISAAGHVSARREGVLTRGAPQLLLTDLGLFRFRPDGEALEAVSLHPEVTAEAVREQTPFPVMVTAETRTTEPASPAELEAIRSIDPLGVRKLEFLKGKAAAEHLAQVQQAERVLFQ